MKKKQKYILICSIIFSLMQLCLFNGHISFADEEQIIEEGIYVIRSVIDDKYVLDVSQASISDGGNIQLFEYVEEKQQQFKVKSTEDGYYTITALHSGKVLDVAYGAKTSGTNVWQFGLNNSDAQKWAINKFEDGTFNIVSKCNGLYLNVENGQAKNGANIQVYTGEESNNGQKFIFEKIKEDNKNENNNEIVEAKQTIADGTYAIKTVINTKYGLDVSQASTSSGANIQLFEDVHENQQRFKIKYIGNGYYTITALHSGKVLDVANAGKTSGTNVWQYAFNNSDAQKWIIKELEDGSYSIISKCNGLYLDVANAEAQNGTNIHMYEGNNSKAQKFIFEEMLQDGIYKIKTVLNEKYILDVNQASISDGANIQLFEDAKENQQRFNVKHIGNGYYTITAIHSGKVLDVAYGAKTSGTNVWQYGFNNSNAQKWLIKYAGNGSYYIVSKCNGLYLDVTNAEARNGANIQVYAGNGSNVQKFKFEKSSIVCDKGTYGQSGLAVKGDTRGTELKYYKFGQGRNVMFATFSIHGFEDSYNHDGSELTYIAEQFKKYLEETTDIQIYNNWTIYILPTLNPDGQTYGWTNNGEGRTTLYSSAPNNKGIDMNRNFQASGESYRRYTDSRNYNGTEAFQAYEARYLREFLLSRKSVDGQTILIDLHGWLNETIGDEGLGKFYQEQYGMTKQIYTYGQGYLINWARMSLGNYNRVARSALIELPQVNSHEELVNKKHAQKYINATINMLKSLR